MSRFISIYLGGVLCSQKRWLDGPEREHGSSPILACRYSINPLHQLRWQVPASSTLPIIQGFVCRLSWLLPGKGWILDTHWLQSNRVHLFTVCLFLKYIQNSWLPSLQLGPAGFGVWRDDYQATIPSEYSIESTYMIFTLHGCWEKLCNLHRYKQSLHWCSWWLKIVGITI